MWSLNVKLNVHVKPDEVMTEHVTQLKKPQRGLRRTHTHTNERKKKMLKISIRVSGFLLNPSW